jgi:hypothetical protein
LFEIVFIPEKGERDMLGFGFGLHLSLDAVLEQLLKFVQLPGS